MRDASHIDRLPDEEEVPYVQPSVVLGPGLFEAARPNAESVGGMGVRIRPRPCLLRSLHSDESSPLSDGSRMVSTLSDPPGATSMRIGRRKARLQALSPFSDHGIADLVEDTKVRGSMRCEFGPSRSEGVLADAMRRRGQNPHTVAASAAAVGQTGPSAKASARSLAVLDLAECSVRKAPQIPAQEEEEEEAPQPAAKPPVAIRRQLSFRVAMMFTITLVVLLCCGAMFVPFELFLRESRSDSEHLRRNGVEQQRTLIKELVYHEVTESHFKTLLHSVQAMIGLSVVDPPRQALDALWPSMQALRKFRAEWNETNREDRALIEYRAWLELSTQFVQDSSKALWQQPHVAWVYVAWETNQFAGVHLDSLALYKDNPKVLAYVSDAPGGSPFGSRLTTRSMDSVTGKPAGQPFHTENYLATDRPYYQTQKQLLDRALSSPGGPSAVPAQGAWSDLYYFVVDNDIGFTWTWPIAYCGNYGCFEGVLAADVTLKFVNVVCKQKWESITKNLTIHGAPVDGNQSAVFLINNVAGRSRQQEGTIVGASHADEALGFRQASPQVKLPKAEDSQQWVVGVTSRALLRKFGSGKTWGLTELADRDQLFTFKPSELEKSGRVVECDESGSKDCINRGTCDCMQVGTSPVQLDEETQWLVVAVLPFGVFATKAVKLAEQVDNNVSNLHDDIDKVVTKGRWWSTGVTLAMILVSIGLGLIVAFLVTRPLRRLGKLMHRLGSMDFAHGTSEFEELRLGRRSRMHEVGKLQQAFCRLSSGIEAFAKFVPELVVRNIVRGDRRMTQLHVTPRRVTIMFADIEGSTTIAEGLEQHDLLFFLTRYFSVMGRIIEQFEGVVAEILGDGLLVFFNAPHTVEGHEGKACCAALAMQQGVNLVNAEFQIAKLPHLAVRIGIHSGMVLSGNIGSDMKMKFGCIGDAVGLAGCFEGLCKRYGVSVICSEATQAAFPEDSGFFCRQLDLVRATPTSEAIHIYEVVGRDCKPMSSRRSSGGKSLSWTSSGSRGSSRSQLPSTSRGAYHQHSRSPAPGDSDDDLERGTHGCGEDADDEAAGGAYRLPEESVRSRARSSGTRMKDPAFAARAAMWGSSEALRCQGAANLFADPIRWLARIRPIARSRIDSWRSGPSAGASGPFTPSPRQAALPRSVGATPTSTIGRAASSAAVALAAVRSSPTARAVGDGCKDLRDEVSPSRRLRVELYEDALKAFKEYRLSEACEVLRVVLDEDPGDIAAQRLLERAQACLDLDPAGKQHTSETADAARWTGEFRLFEQ
mmetsp:Transcript_76326/g.221571  ORF Transcript_76326/g.221571 Transcript_76326/m.221571 type:complete len:1273 (-) Transcript_76326:145-3963(-)